MSGTTIPRPFGVGPFGTGPYMTYPNATVQSGAVGGLAFDAYAMPAFTYTVAAAGRIDFAAVTVLRLTWDRSDGWQCESGGWTNPGSAPPGEWIPASLCVPGTWSRAA